MTSLKDGVLAELQADILRFQGFRPVGLSSFHAALGPLKNSFSNSTFPIGAVHEFLPATKEDSSACCGFVTGLLSSLMGNTGISLWISSSRTLFPPALKSFGIQPDRLIFIDPKNENDVIPLMDEALKCGALSAVVGEITNINFTASRRLQLAVEESQVTGFILRKDPDKIKTTASFSRWKITSIPSEAIEDLPGIGFPKWRVELARIRNGRPGVWDLQWANGKFELTANPSVFVQEEHRRAG